MNIQRLFYVHLLGMLGDVIDGLLWIISFGYWDLDLGFRIRLKNSVRLLRRRR